MRLTKELFSSLMNENDFFNIVLFNCQPGNLPLHFHPNEEILQKYKNKENIVPMAFSANEENIKIAIDFITNNTDHSGIK